MRKIVFLWIALIMVSLHAFADENNMILYNSAIMP